MSSIRRKSLRAAGAFILLGLIAVGGAQTTQRASLANNGDQADAWTPQAAISSDGRYVAFVSAASNLATILVDEIPTATVNHIYKRDMVANTTVLVSVNALGFAGNGTSFNPRISPDGRFVSFSSDSSNLDGPDTNGVRDVFLRDTLLGTTTRVSIGDDEVEGNGVSNSSAISADANLIAFKSDATNLVPGGSSGSQVFLRNRSAGTTVLVSKSDAGVQGNDTSGILQQTITANGRYVGFSSIASNLVPGDTNACWDVFVRDMQLGTMRRISVHNNGSQATYNSHSCDMSDDGRYVAFASFSSLVNGDTNNTWDVFLRDIVANTTTRMSVDSQGKQANATSANADGWGLRITADGSKVVFQSSATNLVKKDFNANDDIFLRNRSNSTTTLISVSSTGAQGNGQSISPTISSNGQYIAFVSHASNLVPGDTNGLMDAFRRGPY